MRVGNAHETRIRRTNTRALVHFIICFVMGQPRKYPDMKIDDLDLPHQYTNKNPVLMVYWINRSPGKPKIAWSITTQRSPTSTVCQMSKSCFHKTVAIGWTLIHHPQALTSSTWQNPIILGSYGVKR